MKKLKESYEGSMIHIELWSIVKDKKVESGTAYRFVHVERFGNKIKQMKMKIIACYSSFKEKSCDKT